MKRLLSFIFPIRLKDYTSEINGSLEVNLVNGRKILDSKKSNYSFGSLQRILHKGLTEIGFGNSFKKILILGLGGGSVIQTIREHFKSDAFIEVVDIDPEIISIAINEFNINNYQKIHIIESDAADYFSSCTNSFDLIIVDLFIGDTVPEKFTRLDFISELTKHLNLNGKIIFNTMRETMPRHLFAEIKRIFSEKGMPVKVIEKVEITNDLIIAG